MQYTHRLISFWKLDDWLPTRSSQKEWESEGWWTFNCVQLPQEPRLESILGLEWKPIITLPSHVINPLHQEHRKGRGPSIRSQSHLQSCGLHKGQATACSSSKTSFIARTGRQLKESQCSSFLSPKMCMFKEGTPCSPTEPHRSRQRSAVTASSTARVTAGIVCRFRNQIKEAKLLCSLLATELQGYDSSRRSLSSSLGFQSLCRMCNAFENEPRMFQRFATKRRYQWLLTRWKWQLHGTSGCWHGENGNYTVRRNVDTSTHDAAKSRTPKLHITHG
jgi:hypothetical protein